MERQQVARKGQTRVVGGMPPAVTLSGGDRWSSGRSAQSAPLQASPAGLALPSAAPALAFQARGGARGLNGFLSLASATRENLVLCGMVSIEGDFADLLQDHTKVRCRTPQCAAFILRSVVIPSFMLAPGDIPARPGMGS